MCEPGFTTGPDLKRPGLDYWGDARVHFHRDVGECLALLGQVPWIVEVGGDHTPWDAPVARGDVVVFGPEDGSVALPMSVGAERVLTLPTKPGHRSLNLAQCAAVVVYDAVRRHGL